LSPEEQIVTYVTPDFIHLYIGIEHVDDIMADLEQELARSRKKFYNN
jgi:O-acetylhomoserine (thiol)-lyase